MTSQNLSTDSSAKKSPLETATNPISENENLDDSALAASINKEINIEIFPINKELDCFISDMENIRQAASIAAPHVSDWLKKEITKTKKALAKYKMETVGQLTTISAQNAGDAAEIVALVRRIEEIKISKASQVIVESLFTQIFAELDSFTGRLLSAIYKNKVELLRGIERQISLTDLLDYTDLEELRNDILNHEIDSFRRDSYVQQFVNLEKKFSLPLRRFSDWPEFVELSQRRNLLIHNGGLVSDQYLTVCAKEGHSWGKRPIVGERLGVNPDYLLRAISLVTKVGFMLSHTLWRKIFPEQLDQAHEGATQSTYELLAKKRWRAAAEFGEFTLSEAMKKGVDDVTLRVRIINTAIGLKFNKQDQRATDLLNSMDWSACYRDFKLAVAVLKENYTEAVEIMKAIGKTGEMIREMAYHEWPLFHKFRETSEFCCAYEDIYKTKFSMEIRAPDADSELKETVADIIKSAKKQIRGKKTKS